MTQVAQLSFLPLGRAVVAVAVLLPACSRAVSCSLGFAVAGRLPCCQGMDHSSAHDILTIGSRS